ncbi:hypothetical protein [Treponema endosymbiont of Eucomonympha sp.]|uniref:hypothetical protein n=1 Tax=Treponema endosymbiont of Eucomonympha sp. TaxID=1580831 RepID=UPI00078434DE|nr:hypothetical protein [Treponema endosymbiont of Eucomonympha sp.]
MKNNAYASFVPYWRHLSLCLCFRTAKKTIAERKIESQPIPVPAAENRTVIPAQANNGDSVQVRFVGKEAFTEPVITDMDNTDRHITTEERSKLSSFEQRTAEVRTVALLKLNSAMENISVRGGS